jgi:hypothetical protein
MNKKLPLDEVFCLGEFVFEDGYENEVLQRKMYNQLEALIREDEKYKQIIVYELVRLENDFAPPGYVSTEEFWEKMGFAKQEDLSYSIPWEDSRTNQQINHTLVGWTKYIE